MRASSSLVLASSPSLSFSVSVVESNRVIRRVVVCRFRLPELGFTVEILLFFGLFCSCDLSAPNSPKVVLAPARNGELADPWWQRRRLPRVIYFFFRGCLARNLLRVAKKCDLDRSWLFTHFKKKYYLWWYWIFYFRRCGNIVSANCLKDVNFNWIYCILMYDFIMNAGFGKVRSKRGSISTQWICPRQLLAWGQMQW